MRIDLNHGPQSSPENNRTSSAASAAARTSSVNTAGVNGAGPEEDQAQLSGAHAQVQALAAQAAQLPEVREERVQSLRQALQSGMYQVSPAEVGGAMFAHMIAGFSAA